MSVAQKSPKSTTYQLKPTAAAASQTASPGPVPVVEQLETALRQLAAAHEELLSLAKVHRSALATANLPALSDCLNAQAAVMQRIGELERDRQRAVASMMAGVRLPGGEKPTILLLCKSLAAPWRERLLAAADRLREVLNRLHQEHTALRVAAQELSSHMEGLMRQVCRKLSHAGTYGRGGHIDSSVTVVTSLDVRT